MADPMGMVTVDEVPFGRFHAKLMFWCGGGALMAGYAVGNIAIPLSVMSGQIPISTAMYGLISSGVLLGSAVGSVVGGRLGDVWGRKATYLADLALLAACFLLQLFVTGPLSCLVLRVATGVCAGATFALSGSLLSELAPRKNRGAMVGSLNLMWFLGYAAANVACYLMLGLGEGSWRAMLASGAVPSIAWLLLSLRMPESPRWLMARGREVDAGRVLARLGEHVVLPREEAPEPKASFAEVFANGNGKWVFFVAFFWSATVISIFSLGTYTPAVLTQLGFGDGDMQYLGTALINMLYLVGVAPSLPLIDKIGRRPVLAGSFGISAVALAALVLTADLDLPFSVVIVLFLLFGAANAAGGSLQYVYPNELFPTSVRSTAVGLVTSISRVVSVVATFSAAFVIQELGVVATMLICAGVATAGLVVTLVMAPETRGMDLAESSSLNAGPSTASGADAADRAVAPAPCQAPAPAADCAAARHP